MLNLCKKPECIKKLGALMSLLIDISQNSQNYSLKKLVPLKLIFYIFFYFFKVYINGDLVQSHKSLSTESKNLTQDWETKAGIGKLDSSLKVKRGPIILPLSV